MTILVDFDYTLFDTDKFVKYLQDAPEVINFENFLFPDVKEFIDYASKFGNLTLFSEGDVDFQKAKINGTRIMNLFPGGVKIFPSFTKINTLLKSNKTKYIVLVDDNPDVVDEAISQGVKVIRIKRGKYKNVETRSKPNFVVENLLEIAEKDLLNKFRTN